MSLGKRRRKDRYRRECGSRKGDPFSTRLGSPGSDGWMCLEDLRLCSASFQTGQPLLNYPLTVNREPAKAGTPSGTRHRRYTCQESGEHRHTVNMRLPVHRARGCPGQGVGDWSFRHATAPLPPPPTPPSERGSCPLLCQSVGGDEARAPTEKAGSD